MHLLPLFLLILSMQAMSADKPLVFVSVLPQKTIVEGIAGDFLHTEVMVGKGFNPATYQPSPQQITRLSKAVLYVRAGMPFEQSWLPRFISVNPSMKVLDMREGLQLLPAHDHHPSHGHHAAETDPHVWTDPTLVRLHAQQLRDTLSQLYPAQSSRFDENYRRFATQLEQLDRELKRTLAPLQGSSFLVYHPAWSYFARRYGVQQIAVEHEGKEPNPRRLAQLVEVARKANIHIILVQPQHSSATAKVLADAIDARLLEMDPLEEDFAAALRKLAHTLAGELP